MINHLMVFLFVKSMITPFREWDAFKTGVIDASGTVLVKSKDRTKAQRDSFTAFNILTRNIKRILEKLPGGATRLASFAAALYLIREHNAFSYQDDKVLNESADQYSIDLDKLGRFVTETVTAAIVQSDGWMSKEAQKRWTKQNDDKDIFAGVR